MSYEDHSEGGGRFRYEGPTEADIERSERARFSKRSPTGTFLMRAGITLVLLVVAGSLVFTLIGPLAGQSPQDDTRAFTTAIVVQVIDPRTIGVRFNGRDAIVRYIGVETPELGDQLYAAARQASVTWLNGKTVTLEADAQDADEEGRLLRYVYVDGNMVNAALLANGLARASTDGPNSKYRQILLDIERQARDAGWGIWAGATTSTRPAAPAPAAVLLSRRL